MINTTNHTALAGLIRNSTRADGMVPMIAPTTGIRAVTPMIVLISKAYSKRKSFIPAKQRTPRITASVIWPLTNLVNISKTIR